VTVEILVKLGVRSGFYVTYHRLCPAKSIHALIQDRALAVERFL
jgi:hypothetical protein